MDNLQVSGKNAVTGQSRGKDDLGELLRQASMGVGDGHSEDTRKLERLIANADRIRPFVAAEAQKEFDHAIDLVRDTPELGSASIFIRTQIEKVPDGFRFEDYHLIKGGFETTGLVSYEPIGSNGKRINGGLKGRAFLLNSDDGTGYHSVLLIAHAYYEGKSGRGPW